MAQIREKHSKRLDQQNSRSHKEDIEACRRHSSRRLSTKQLKASLRSKDPEKSLLFASWPVAKILRRVKAFAEKRRKLFTIPPQYTSRICPRCNSMMRHERRRWDRLVCRCGFRDDRDNVAVRNIARTALILSEFHYLNTILGKQLREYKQVIDKLTPKISKALLGG